MATQTPSFTQGADLVEQALLAQHVACPGICVKSALIADGGQVTKVRNASTMGRQILISSPLWVLPSFSAERQSRIGSACLV